MKHRPVARPKLAVSVTGLQHAWLGAMGVDVPWIKVQAEAKAAMVQDRAGPQAEPSGLAPGVPLRPATPMVREAQPPSAAAPRPDLGGLCLDELAEQVRHCQQCALCATRRHAVAGQGVSHPQILVVGEAPGEQEDVEGQPFVGRSGQLLDNMLRSIGHDRGQTVYITNVVKCRPPANRNPKDEEIAACRAFLDRQLELLRPRVVLAMGRFAAHTLLNTDVSLQNLRQRPLELTVSGQPVPVVVTYHPAYLLRRPVDKRLAWDDLKRVASLL